MSATLRIGVDVGGTNTDGVLLDPLAASSSNKGILAWHKSPTTSNPSEGIENVINTLLQNAQTDVHKVASVTIGTTHFINAVVEMDQNRLSPVAIIRLSGPFSREVYPGIDWPPLLRDTICKYWGFVDGGLEVDGDLINTVKEVQVAEQCEKIKALGIKSIVVNGIFSPLDMVEKQEERVGDWVKKYYPEADVVLAKEVANLGFIERENAAILNASILSFARQTISSFQNAIHRLKLSCPVFLTQNDGTILPAPLAARLPIRTFSSGPTNSMCGAAFLVGGTASANEAMLVVDIGGTTTDVGMLLASGLPRQAAAVAEISGVRMNFSCPDVKSIGLGGGSIVRKHDDGHFTIGPDSVGHRIHQEALVFGGGVHTATDYAVASQNITTIGDASKSNVLEKENVKEYEAVVKTMLERIVDRMKTSAEDIPVLLVGGGVVLAPDTLVGASRVEKPEYAGVANAVGAAIAKVSGTVDTVVVTSDKSTQETLAEVSNIAIERAVANGAKRETVIIAEMESLPLMYIAGKARVIIKAIGEFDFSRSSTKSDLSMAGQEEPEVIQKKPLRDTSAVAPMTPEEMVSYRPVVNSKREWIISELDLEWISTGCYILGTGGGGNPYGSFIRLKDDDVVACGGGKGSPTVGIEKLAANEMMEAQNAVYKQVGYQPNAVIALEIGGGNGLQGCFYIADIRNIFIQRFDRLLLGASCNMNIPTIDADWMGRAYPVSWQITPVVWGGDKAQFLPTAISDGNGNLMLMTEGNTEKIIERAFRAALSEMGSHVACAKGLTPEQRPSLTASRTRYPSHGASGAPGGSESAKVLFKGKIVGVERRTFKGHAYGEVEIAAMDVSGSGHAGAEFSGTMKIPFKNENILATVTREDGKDEVVASVPDLICVCDATNGEAIGTPEYKYGLLVVVIGIQASDKWTSIPRGIEIGGPRAFGMDVDYKPLGKFNLPKSIIDEYGPA
ncbi:hypothetical protein CPB85DRAFT_1431292 [Mucidula mucida]|nr:hypothetical protein CPB85DRAFT_1431292 [Mucidula mucida]